MGFCTFAVASSATSTLFTTACTLATSGLFPPAADAAPKTVQALDLRQEHVYLGKVRVLLTPHAMKIDGQGKLHFTVICRAPNWQVTAYRSDDKIAFTESFKEFCDQGLFSNIVLTQRDDKLRSGGEVFSTKVNGFPVVQIRLPMTMVKYLRETKYAAPQAAPFFHSAYRVPTEGHIPITFEMLMSGKDWMTNLSEQGQRRVILETDKISLTNVPSTEFEIPSGMKTVKSMTRIIVGDSYKMQQTGVDNLFNLGH